MADEYIYDPSEAEPKDQVRGLIGDVQGKDNTGAPDRISDGKITALLTAFATDEDGGILRAAVEAARIRYRSVAGQKGANDRAPGLEPERRFQRLRQVWEDLKAQLEGADASTGPPIMTPSGVFPCGVKQAKIGALDEGSC